MIHLLIYLQGDRIVCDVIGRYDICVVADKKRIPTYTFFGCRYGRLAGTL